MATLDPLDPVTSLRRALAGAVPVAGLPAA